MTLVEILTVSGRPDEAASLLAGLPSGSSRDHCRREVDLALVLAFGLNRSRDAAERLERLLDEVDDRRLGLRRRPDPPHVAAGGRDPPGPAGRRGRPRRRAVVRDRPVHRRAGAGPGAEPHRPAGHARSTGRRPCCPGWRTTRRSTSTWSASWRPRCRPGHRYAGDLDRAEEVARRIYDRVTRPGRRAAARRLRAPARPDRPLAGRAGARRAVLPRGRHGARTATP